MRSLNLKCFLLTSLLVFSGQNFATEKKGTETDGSMDSSVLFAGNEEAHSDEANSGEVNSEEAGIDVLSREEVSSEEANSEFDESDWKDFDDGEDWGGFEELTPEDGTINLSVAETETESLPQLDDRGYFYRLAPYYSSLGYTWALSEDSRTKMIDGNEWQVFEKMLRQSLVPEFFTLEASIYPMPLLGVAIRKELPDVYEDANYGDDFNLVEAVTAGFDEPYAISALFSSTSAYRPHESSSDSAPNVGFMGYLLSLGDQHIFKNELIQDLWYELEWKIKGSFESGPESFDWGIQLGVKTHRNENITDTLNMKLERNNIVQGGNLWSLRQNTGYSLKVSTTRAGFELVEISAFITKYFPITDTSFTPALAIGVIRQDGRKYSQDFQQENSEVETYTLAIRPTVVF